jgi:hypothetical protein
MLDRTVRQCRERRHNYLNPAIRTEAEDNSLIEKVNEVGHLWVSMTPFFNGRSESDVKNRWYSHLRSRCAQNAASGKWARTRGPEQAATTERKARNRTKAWPSRVGQAMLEETQDSESFSDSPSESFDFWDHTLCECTLEVSENELNVN